MEYSPIRALDSSNKGHRCGTNSSNWCGPIGTWWGRHEEREMIRGGEALARGWGVSGSMRELVSM